MKTQRKLIKTETTLNELLTAEQALSCPTCDKKWDRERGHELLQKLGTWWISAETGQAIGRKLFLRVHDKTPSLQNIGVVFCIAQSDSTESIPVFLYEIQHEYPGKAKPGLHYQLQVPHGDVGKNMKDPDKKRAISRAWHRSDTQMEIYRSNDQYRSIRHGKALGNLDKIQSLIISLAKDLIQAFEETVQ